MKFILWKVTFSIFLALTGAASSATISAYRNLELNCHIKLDGPIEAGDARRLEAVWNSIEPYPDWDDTLPRRQNYALRSGARICLSSVGGSSSEALEIVDFLQTNFIGTAVESESNCLSACSLIFMGGSTTGDDLEVIWNRVLEPGASLGFHAFSLPTDGGVYTGEQVQDIFDLGIAAVVELAERNILPDSLLQEMLRTPSHDMLMVDQVGQASAWAIGIHSSLFLDDSPEVLIFNACANAVAALAEQPQIDTAALWVGRGVHFNENQNENAPHGVEASLSIPISPFAVVDCTTNVRWDHIMGEPRSRYVVSHHATVDGRLDFTNHWVINGEFVFSPAFSFPPDYEIENIGVRSGQSQDSFVERIINIAGLTR